MLKLKIQKEPYWLEIGYGVKVKVKPCTSAVFYEAKAYMNAKLAELAKIYKSNKDIGINDENAEDIENPRMLLIQLMGVTDDNKFSKNTTLSDSTRLCDKTRRSNR